MSHAEPTCLGCAYPEAVTVSHLHAFGVSAMLELLCPSVHAFILVAGYRFEASQAAAIWQET